jgi:hypothetical protein
MEASDDWFGTFEGWLDLTGAYEEPECFDTLLADDQTILNVALYLASDLGLIDILEPLVKLGAHPNRRIHTADGYPIIAAAVRGEHQSVQELIRRGADLTATSMDGGTLLWEAVMWNRREVVQVLLDKGLDINMYSSSGTPLMTALCWHYSEMIQMLLEKGAHVDIDSIRELLTSGTGCETQSERLIDELADISGLNSRELAKLLSRVHTILTRRNELLTLGPGSVQSERFRERDVFDDT